MPKRPNPERAKPVSQNAYLETDHLVQVIRNIGVPEQALESGSSGQGTPQATTITSYLGQASTRPAPQSKLLHVNEKTRMTTDDVHPGWVRATAILLRGMERLRAREIEEAKATE